MSERWGTTSEFSDIDGTPMRVRETPSKRDAQEQAARDGETVVRKRDSVFGFEWERA